jgi:large subunit ribosomal protein L21
MYAVIETGGKQYRVEVGTELQVELLDVEPGRTITLDRVLMVADGDESSIGRPVVADAAVSAKVVRQIRGEKLISFKYRPKARSRVKKGHRQELTVLLISDITLNGRSAAQSAEKAQQEAKTERQRLEEAATVQAALDAELAARLAVGAAAPAKVPAKATRTTATGTAPAVAAAPTRTAARTRTAVTPRTAAAPAAGKAKVQADSAEAASEVAPRKSRAKATSTDLPPADDAPKRSRATRKDE